MKNFVNKFQLNLEAFYLNKMNLI